MSIKKQTSDNHEHSNPSLGVVMCWAVTEDYQPVDYGEMYTTIIAVFTEKTKAKEYRDMLESKDNRRRPGDYELTEIPLNPPCT